MTAENLDALEAEAQLEEGYVSVPLGDDLEVVVPPAGEWGGKAMRALHDANFDLWAELVLSDEDYEACSEVDPTLNEWGEFFQEMTRRTGQDKGKSRNSGRSSKSTRRK